MPHGEAVLGNHRAEDGACCGFEQRAHGLSGDDAHHKTCQHEKLGGKAHQERRLTRRARQLFGRGPKKHVAYKAQRVSDSEHARDGDHVGQRLIYKRVVVNLDRLGEEHLLGQEPIEQRNAGHGSGGDHGQGRRDRHEPPEAAQSTNVARAAFVVDDAGGHEQRRLEGRVIHDVEDCGDLAERGIEPYKQRDQPKIADGRISEQPL